jgi:predicted GH43/DUF377 family glycosyl hydrolase
VFDFQLPKEIDFTHNPSVAWHDGHLYITFRGNKVNKENDPTKKHYQNFLLLSELDPDTLELKYAPKITKMNPENPDFGIEDVRIFSRDDKLYGIGARIYTAKDSHGQPKMGIGQTLIEIDPKTYIYKHVYDYPQPSGMAEKNWSPPEVKTRWFDYVYSPTQIFADDKVYGAPTNSKIHGGSQLLPYGDNQWLSIAHVVQSVRYPFQMQRFYSSVAVIRNETGFVTHISQLFHFGAGDRRESTPALNEWVEFVSGAIWLEKDKRLLVSMGVKDITSGVAEINIDDLRFEPFKNQQWYGNRFAYDNKPNYGSYEL